ncbi:MAG: CheR family methyltransferase [bacterium]
MSPTGKTDLPPNTFVHKMLDREFNKLRQFVYQYAGITLGDHKRDLLITRLSRRLRALRFSSFKEYLDYLDLKDNDNEIEKLVNCITTNVTGFYREINQFKLLEKSILDDYCAGMEKKGERHLKVWSAGSSSGEEAYTISIELTEYFLRHTDWSFEIFASDIDTNILAKAREAVYPVKTVADIPAPLLKKYFLKGIDQNTDKVKLKSIIRDRVKYGIVNLIYDAYPYTDCDIIFCRNVMIYFSSENRRKIIRKFYNSLKPGGFFFVGHSESVLEFKDEFDLVAASIYRKK